MPSQAVTWISTWQIASGSAHRVENEVTVISVIRRLHKKGMDGRLSMRVIAGSIIMYQDYRAGIKNMKKRLDKGAGGFYGSNVLLQ